MYSLVLFVLHEMSQLDEVMTAWREAGAPAITILDSVGTREMDEYGHRDDLPLMPTIKDLLQGDDAPRKTMFSIVENASVDALIKATEEVVGDLSEEGKGILAVMELSNVVGYRGP
jgi:hypothetical protein